MKSKLLIFVLFCLLIAVLDGVVFKLVLNKAPIPESTIRNNLPLYTSNELKKFDGTTEGEKILLGMNGYVYDVTAGKEYYFKGGVYHYLAGKDSSKELNLFGGSIIKKKYPIVGILDDEK